MNARFEPHRGIRFRPGVVALLIVSSTALGTTYAHALPRDPAVSRTHIAFVEAGQLWVMPRGGGVAARVSDLTGHKHTPRFSPDGTRIAFGSNERRGEANLYTVALAGGTPSRITFLPSQQTLSQWTADGRLVFHTNSLSFSRAAMKLYTVGEAGGLPTPLPVAYGSDGAIDESGEWLAYTPIWQISLMENWKRYRGGAAPDLWLMKLGTGQSRRITEWKGSDLGPMWHGTTLYYLSDEGDESRRNVWAYELRGGARRQVTHFRHYDVRNASLGGDAIVFELGPDLQLLDLSSGKTTPVRTQIPPAQSPPLQREVDASGFITNRQLSKGGTQVLIEARGDLWIARAGVNSPAPRNLTATSGAFEREAALSPAGRKVAYWSDATGEYQLYIRDVTGAAPVAPLTRFTAGFRYRPVWSPDSRRIAYADQRGAIVIFDVVDRKTRRVDTEPWAEPTELAWSADSRWLAYMRTGPNRLTAIWGYDLATGKPRQLTAEAFNASTPVFDPNGEWFYFISYRNFNQSNVDWIQQRITHRATTVVMAVPLRGTSFDAASFERRAVRLGAAPGAILALGVTHDGGAIYSHLDLGGKSSVRRYDPRQQKEVVVRDDGGLTISPDGRFLLVDRDGKSFVRALGDSTESIVHTTGMKVRVDLRDEWRQIFQDTWRYYRDFFYAPRVGLGDWNLVRTRYAAMLERCLIRAEVNLVLGEMIGESSVGHAYLSEAGDVGDAPPPSTLAMLGADFALENGAFRITRVHEGAPWDDRARSPLRDARVGQYLLAVNGTPIDTRRDPRAAFLGMAGKAVQVTVGAHSAKDRSARQITITPLSTESDLRRRAWIEDNRKHVTEVSGGRIGYLHVPDFTTGGFNDLIQQFSGQIGKEALIIDTRWSMGGWTSSITAELMERFTLTFAAIRESDHVWPGPRWGAHFGPKALLVNHQTASAGESFAYFFRKRSLGPLVGTRTWGGSTGLNPVPSLLDGGYANVPNAPFFDADGWLWESHGLDPDLPIEPDPARMVSEGDPQIDAAVKVMLEALASNPYRPPSEPGGDATSRNAR